MTRARAAAALATAAALALAALAAPAAAKEAKGDTLAYRVRQGDTLALIAAEFYGDRSKAIFIMVENKLTHARPLKPGERLRIPVSRDITTAPSDTFESLAGVYLGDPRRGTFLADFNGMSADDGLAAGTQLQVPFAISHTAEATETLAQISLAFFGDAKQAEMLRLYNFLDRAALEKGESIVVPIFNVRLQASKMPAIDAEAKQRRAARREVSARAATALPAAWQAWRVGDYAEIERLLAKVEIAYLDLGPAVEVGILRGCAHIAENKAELALEDFKEVLDRKPSHTLRRFDHSPKILEIWEKADGRVE